MGLYSIDEENYGLDMDALVEAFLIDDLTHNYGEDAIHEFCAPGGVADALLEAKILSNKKTVVRLDKISDAKRRMTIAAIQLAKKHKDPNFMKLVKYKILFKQARQKIVDKYGAKATKASIKAQKQYVKSMRGVNISNNVNTSITDAKEKANKK